MVRGSHVSRHAFQHQLDRMCTKSTGQNPVGRTRRTSALNVPEDCDARVVACVLFDVAPNFSTTPRTFRDDDNRVFLTACHTPLQLCHHVFEFVGHLRNEHRLRTAS